MISAEHFVELLALIVKLLVHLRTLYVQQK